MTYAEKVEKLMKVRQLCLDYTGEDIFHAEINTAIDKTLAEIAKIVGVAPEEKKRTPLELPLGVTLNRISSTNETLFIGKRMMKTVSGEEASKICRVECDRVNGLARVYYGGVKIGRVKVEGRSGRFLERAGVGMLHAYLAITAHNKDVHARQKAKRGEFVTPKPIADFVMANPPLSAEGQQADNNKGEEGK